MCLEIPVLCESCAGSRAIACSACACMSMDPTDMRIGVSGVNTLCNTFGVLGDNCGV